MKKHTTSSRLTRGRKIGVARTWRRNAGWLCSLLLMLILGSAWQSSGPSRVKNDIGRASKPLEEIRLVEVTQRGQRAVGLGFPAADPVASAVRAGDRIDVTGAFATAPDGQPLARTILNHVLVITAARQGATVGLTVSVTPQEAEALAFAAANARLSLALCPAGPDTGRPTDGVTFGDL